MKSFDCSRYRPFLPINNPGRRWPDKTIAKAPTWASVDLRDGNQALLSPMGSSKKLRMFDLLVKMGFKEIEVGFPSASRTEYDFVRRLIEEGRIPDDVTIQVLTQAREDLIARSFEALKGSKRSIMHFYNSLNSDQRLQVFRRDRAGVKDLALQGARLIRDISALYPETEWIFQYTPESFSATEPDFALEVCSAVKDIWQPKKGQKVILNLPATVEISTPNVFADQVEWFLDHLPGRDEVIVSVHTHNDRGCAVSAAELAVMAGADRVEGTLFGNGERTGNMDILTMAMNLYSHGVDPKLDLSFSCDIVSGYTECTGIAVPPRHPWFGELVYTATSGSHQDAIHKGLAHHRNHGGPWSVPYLPIDPQDIGRDYDEIVRINSQSGKSGIAHVLERDHHIELPVWLMQEFGEIVQSESEKTGGEIDSSRILVLFEETFLKTRPEWTLSSYRLELEEGEAPTTLTLMLGTDHQRKIQGQGRGTVESLMDGLHRTFLIDAEVVHFSEHALEAGTDANAIAFVKIRARESRNRINASAAALGKDTTEATLQAVLLAVAKLV
ncbi:MAG: 2-isopropylmalate synthase [Leptospirales bacterium]